MKRERRIMKRKVIEEKKVMKRESNREEKSDGRKE
jgi:hypothetical protein